MRDFAKYPRPALRGAPDHDGIGAGIFEHVTCFLRCGDIAVGDDRNTHRSLYGADSVVFGITGVRAGARAPVYR